MEPLNQNQLHEDSQLEEYIRRLNMVGLNWQKAPPKPEKPVVATAAVPATCRPKYRSTSKTKAAAASSTLDSESESEMIGKNCTTDLTGDIAMQKNMAKRGIRKHKDTISPGMAAKLEREAFKDLGLKLGDEAAKHEVVVPWKFLVRYAELYVGKTNTPIVEPYFEPSDILENQDWDIYYLYEPADLLADPILFVPTCQLDAYLCKINTKLDLTLRIPGGGNEIQFARQFGWLSTPQPRYLGRTNGDGSLQKLAAAVPLPDPEDDPAKATQAERDEFSSLLENIKKSCVGGKGNGKGSKARKKAYHRYESRKAWGKVTKRVQRYLGLRENVPSVVSHDVYIGQEESANKLVLNVDAPVPFDPEDDVVFICCDIETYEKSPMLVTEVGFAILDTKDLRGVAPGEGAQNWFRLINGRHLRVKEYRNMRNHQYVRGWPDCFQFGKSEFVGIEKIARTCTEIFTPKSPSGEPRKVVIVGHDIKQDIALLYSIDVDIYELPGLLEIVDNQRMQQHNSRYRDPQRLSIVLTGLDIPHRYLHNGGNDAVYTLQSMLALAVIRRQTSLTAEPKPKDMGLRPKPEFGEPMVDAGWSTGGENTDGGSVPSLVDPNAYTKVQGLVAGANTLIFEDY